MALIQCKECGKQISDTAVSCPNCGAKNKNNNEEASTGLKIICFLIPLIGIIIFAINITTRPKYAKACLIASILPTIILVVIVLFIYVSNSAMISEGVFTKHQNISYDTPVFKIDNKYVDKNGYITTTSNSSTIQIQGMNIRDSQERLDEDSLELLSKLLELRNTLKVFHLLDKVNKIDVINIDDVKIYINSEDKIIQLGNFEYLSSKFACVENIMKQEKGKKGTIFVKDTSKAYFREDI